MASTIVRNFIAKALFKKKGAIANNKAVEFSSNALEQRLKNLGIDPNAITNENELNQILSYVKQAEDQAFSQRFGDILAGSRFDKQADVLDMTGKKIDPRSKIMGGKQAETEAEIKVRLEKENKEAAERLKQKKLDDYEDDLPMAQGGRAGFKSGTYDHTSFEHKINELKAAFKRYKKGSSTGGRGGKMTFEQFAPLFAAENFATGGRAGYKIGTGKKGIQTLFNFFNKKSPYQAGRDYLKNIKDKTLKANETGKFMDLPLAEVGIPATTGALINNQLRKKLEAMNEEQKEQFLKEFIQELNADPFYKKNPELKDKTIEAYTEKMFGEKRADGGRIGLKDGMDRRTFMKIMAGITALPVLGKFFKGAKVASKTAPIIKTPNALGKPEWFDALVTKVVNEGADVTKGFATKERQLVHTKQINDFAEVTVYRDLDTNTTTVNYGTKLRKDPTKPYEKGNISRAVNDPDQIDLVVKGAEDIEPTIIENEKGFVRRRGTKSSAEFEAYESEPRVVNFDGDMEFDGTNVVNNVDDLNEDVSVLKEYATGKKLNPKEAAKAKKKQEDYQKFLEDPVEQANYLESKYGPGPEPDDFASGGIARMLGE